MKNLVEYIKEAKMQSDKWIKYGEVVIDAILDGKTIRLGEHGEKGSFSIQDLTSEQHDALRMLKHNIMKSTVDDFNKIFYNHPYTGLKRIAWTKLFKGDFTGYVDGVASKNRGNEFEVRFAANVDEYEDEIKKIVPFKVINNVELVGGRNNKRPLTFTGNTITFGNPHNFNIGSVVADIELNVDNNKPIYLSLKYGNKLTFINSGVKELFPLTFFKNGEQLSKEAKSLLDMLHIDEERFRRVFNTYGQGSENKKAKYEVDITNELKNSKEFRTFMKSAIGYGYVYVHDTGKGVKFLDFTTEDKLDAILTNISSAKVQYPVNGNAKRIDVIVAYKDTMEFDINIRNKHGEVYPSHIMVDYKLTYK